MALAKYPYICIVEGYPNPQDEMESPDSIQIATPVTCPLMFYDAAKMYNTNKLNKA